jgi:hypothetical protein
MTTRAEYEEAITAAAGEFDRSALEITNRYAGNDSAEAADRFREELTEAQDKVRAARESAARDYTTGARAGAETADQVIKTLADAGMGADRIERHHQDESARLLSDAETAEGQAFAQSYDYCGRILVADLRDLEAG